MTFSLADLNTSPAAPLIRITFDPSAGNWSALGSLAQNVATAQATMNLGWIFDSVDEHPFEKGVMLHEFGHALGLVHEYSGELLNPSGEL